MPLLQTQTTSFKSELYQGIHALNTDVLMIALYSASANLNSSTTVYTTTGEVTGTGYVAGGIALSGVSINSGNDTAWVSFSNPAWPSSTITARGALIYNASKANRSVAILDFGSDRSSSNTTFLITMPASTYTTALIRSK